jgi:hypothetical protein
VVVQQKDMYVGLGRESGSYTRAGYAVSADGLTNIDSFTCIYSNDDRICCVDLINCYGQ